MTATGAGADTPWTCGPDGAVCQIPGPFTGAWTLTYEQIQRIPDGVLPRYSPDQLTVCGTDNPRLLLRWLDDGTVTWRLHDDDYDSRYPWKADEDVFVVTPAGDHDSFNERQLARFSDRLRSSRS